ncbi:MAG: sel1 repeat family protein [Rhodospirillales bacterium]|nr:sel1 repeat family protein [Rhodospirillales bacterium]
MSDNGGHFSKEEYLAHVAKKQQDELNELRINKPSLYAAIQKGKKPSKIHLLVVCVLLFGGMIVRYYPDIQASISEIGSPKIKPDFDRGLDAYYKRDYARALSLWLPLAEQGHTSAQVYVGVMHNDGKGVPQDIQKALRWTTLAAEQGHPDAQNTLGEAFYGGKGVPKDIDAAVKWATIAANQRQSDSQILLGILHYKGEGLPKNDVLAAMWWQIASSQANTRAGGLLKKVREGMSPAQLKTAKELAHKWMQEHPYPN